VKKRAIVNPLYASRSPAAAPVSLEESLHEGYIGLYWYLELYNISRLRIMTSDTMF
jgi:hypothetical protein